MKNTCELIKELQTKTNDWEMILNQYVCDDLQEDNPYYSNAEKIINLLVEEYKKNKNISKEVCEIFESQENVDIIEQKIKENLQWYFDLELFRQISNTDIEKAKRLVDKVVNGFILSIDNNLAEKIKNELELNQVEDEIINRAAYALDFYTISSVENRFSSALRTENLAQEGNLPEEFCEYFSSLIEKNIIEMKLNIIMRNQKMEE